MAQIRKRWDGERKELRGIDFAPIVACCLLGITFSNSLKKWFKALGQLGIVRVHLQLMIFRLR
jgi:hypothetical protein